MRVEVNSIVKLMPEINRTRIDSMCIMSVSELKDMVSIPDFQRKSDEEHVENIFNSLLGVLQRGEEPKLIGCMVVMVTPDYTYYLSDGNHRLKAFTQLLAYGYDLKVYVQKINVDNEEEKVRLFEQANNSLPVPSLPEGVKRSAVNRVTEYFYSRYGSKKSSVQIKPIFVSNRSGCANRPRISRDKFEYHIGNLIQQGISGEDIINKLEKYNEELNRKHCSYFKKQSNDSHSKLDNFLKGADIYGCRLGMILTDSDYSQLYRLFRISPRGTTLTRTKKKIPNPLRQTVWERYYGRNNRTGECPFCRTEITCINFHCAHDTAEASGGETTIDNLYPCCASCNLSMGKQTFEQFMRHWRNGREVNVLHS